MRILRNLLMLLALLSMVGHPASAASSMHAQTVTPQAVHQHHHHHHDVDGADAGRDEAAAGHKHHCPGHHHDGKCCDSTCCATNCLSAAAAPTSGRSIRVLVAKTPIPAGDSLMTGTIPFLPDRPPIAI